MIPVLEYKQAFQNGKSSNPTFKKLQKFYKLYEELLENQKILQLELNLFTVEHKGKVVIKNENRLQLPILGVGWQMSSQLCCNQNS